MAFCLRVLHSWASITMLAPCQPKQHALQVPQRAHQQTNNDVQRPQKMYRIHHGATRLHKQPGVAYAWPISGPFWYIWYIIGRGQRLTGFPAKKKVFCSPAHVCLASAPTVQSDLKGRDGTMWVVPCGEPQAVRGGGMSTFPGLFPGLSSLGLSHGSCLS